MPELPEVETIRRGLAQALIGHKILSVDSRQQKLFHGNPAELTSQKVIEIERRAKLLIWKLEKNFLLIHLKMTGQLLFIPKNGQIVIGGHPDSAYNLELPHKHSHVIFEFDHGTLYFNDLRKFGWIKLINNPEEIKLEVSKFGPEYDWPEFTYEYFGQKLSSRKSITIKQALLDQSIVAGIGNIYADETLFCAKVHPRSKVSNLAQKQIKSIHLCIPIVLNLALQKGGSSSQSYFHVDGKLGSYLGVAKVYKREGLPCLECGTPIARFKIAGRSSHYCPSCQG